MPYRNLVSLPLSRAESHGRLAYCIHNGRGERILLQGPSRMGEALYGGDINVTVNRRRMPGGLFDHRQRDHLLGRLFGVRDDVLRRSDGKIGDEERHGDDARARQ